MIIIKCVVYTELLLGTPKTWKLLAIKGYSTYYTWEEHVHELTVNST